jgi:hypothetical protein
MMVAPLLLESPDSAVRGSGVVLRDLVSRPKYLGSLRKFIRPVMKPDDEAWTWRHPSTVIQAGPT